MGKREREEEKKRELKLENWPRYAKIHIDRQTIKNFTPFRAQKKTKQTKYTITI